MKKNKALPEFENNKIQKIHFIGIGGVGMSALAIFMHNKNITITGSNNQSNDYTKKLEALGIEIYYQHSAENLKQGSLPVLVVITRDIRSINPELQEAKKLSLKIIYRSDLLAHITSMNKTIAISGSHGKTTTTNMTGTVFNNLGLNPTIFCGGTMLEHNSNIKLGGATNSYIIAEADESDGSMVDLSYFIAIITNMSNEHFSYYKTYNNLVNKFKDFINGVDENGIIILCKDDPNSLELINYVNNETNINYLTYGIKNIENTNIYAENIMPIENGILFDLIINYKNQHIKYEKILLPTLGMHNLLNALAAISAAFLVSNIYDNNLTRNLENSFRNYIGVKRRFNLIGKIKNAFIIDDYAHHPNEIMAILNMAEQAILVNNKPDAKIIIIFEPHRYSRIKYLFNDFVNILTDKRISKILVMRIWEADEEITQEERNSYSENNLVEEINQKKTGTLAQIGHNYSEIRGFLEKNAYENDYILCLSAGGLSDYINKEFYVNN